MTDNGNVFLNGEGRTILTAELWKGNKSLMQAINLNVMVN